MTLITSDETYRDIILRKISENVKVKAYKTQLSAAMDAHNSFLSQVLNGQAQLTFDQASALCDFWEFGEEDAEYFLLLVSIDRASTESLRQRLKVRLAKMRAKHYDVPAILFKEDTSTPYLSAKFQSTWHHMAILNLLALPEFRSAEAIAARLNLSVIKVRNSLELLIEMGRVAKEDGLHVRSDLGFVGMEGDFASIFLSSVKQKAISMIENKASGDIFYSGFHSIYKSDLERLGQLVRELVSKFHSTQKSGPDKDSMVLLNVDLIQF